MLKSLESNQPVAAALVSLVGCGRGRVLPLLEGSVLGPTSDAQLFPGTEQQRREQRLSSCCRHRAPPIAREEGPGVSSFSGTEDQRRLWQLQPLKEQFLRFRLNTNFLTFDQKRILDPSAPDKRGQVLLGLQVSLSPWVVSSCHQPHLPLGGKQIPL